MEWYAKVANSNYFELCEQVQTSSYWAAVYEAGQCLHKISIDERWK